MISPYDTGLLDVGDGHQVYWEACGNPDGVLRRGDPAQRAEAGRHPRGAGPRAYRRQRAGEQQ
ncbi:hypothetical protein [Micromonospora sp. NBC_01813]|uniref:hypothetical protein n=1 Tax=Micromonospora sp. NBC_01813 TaxID=2975988 RepID=UPI002DDBFF35|nr:hypothetical protein [Micromonospora sp. NBC_01813]WSA10492.1 hypothetical protein OG958_06810 [Micromonospora sp. NBC_01813]